MRLPYGLYCPLSKLERIRFYWNLWHCSNQLTSTIFPNKNPPFPLLTAKKYCSIYLMKYFFGAYIYIYIYILVFSNFICIGIHCAHEMITKINMFLLIVWFLISLISSLVSFHMVCFKSIWYKRIWTIW
jgi:hypothetical protein